MISPVFSRVAIAVVCTMGRPAINPVAASAATEAAVEIDVIAQLLRVDHLRQSRLDNNHRA